VDATEAAAWADLFAAQMGATAALLGLVFVGVSINLTRIMASGLLVDRALEAVVLLLMSLTVATLGLVPGQPAALLGAEALVAGLVAWGVLVRFQARSRRRLAAGQRGAFVLRVALGQAATLSFVLGGAAMLAGTPAGLYGLAAGMLAATVGAVVDSWVLLVEILR
jgi:modulator of FtsH protease